jgi:hypothetical protein
MGFFGGGGGAAPANMGGATSSAAGTAGLVPAPAAGEDELFLKGNALFQEGPIPQRTFTSGYFCNDAFSTIEGTNSWNASRTHYNLIWIPRRMSFDRIGFTQNTAGLTHNVRIGLYNSSLTTGLPSTVKFDAGEITLNGAGTYTVTISQTVEAGFYWGAVYTGSTGINTPRFTGSYYWGYLRGKVSSSESSSTIRFPYSQSVPTNSATSFSDNPTITGENQQALVVFLRKT